jgi:exoribonuclease R
LDNGEFRVSIYIANVYLWLDTLGLWDSFSKRVATIYLPDRRRPMLPTILSDTLCSLQQKQPRFAFVMDVVVGEFGIRDVQYKNVLINVHRNYHYDEPDLYNDEYYKKLFEISKRMDPLIQDSHDIVSHWMVYMNVETAGVLYNDNTGVFRSVNFVNPVIETIDGMDKDTIRVIQTWNNTIGQYVAYGENIDTKHDFMKTKSYIHITSPIRRLVDLLNQIILFRSKKLVCSISQGSEAFLNRWLKELDYLNISMRSIRKVQTDCALLDRCFRDPEIMEREYTGIIFDKMVRDNFIISYMVYLKELKMLSRINIIADLENFGTYNFKLYLFQNEEKTKKKIRLQLLVK